MQYKYFERRCTPVRQIIILIILTQPKKTAIKTKMRMALFCTALNVIPVTPCSTVVSGVVLLCIIAWFKVVFCAGCSLVVVDVSAFAEMFFTSLAFVFMGALSCSANTSVVHTNPINNKYFFATVVNVQFNTIGCC